MHADIVLVGYYGRSNFGDDVLLKVTYALISRFFPKASIAVQVEPNAGYIHRVLEGQVTALPYGTRGKHRLIVHGGGGNFFDFDAHGFVDRVLNRLLFSCGVTSYVHAESLVRRLVERPRLSARMRLGMGLGIGSFSPGSPRLRAALPILQDFDALWLRDQTSVDNLAIVGGTVSAEVGSDLAFLSEFWCPPSLFLAPRQPLRERPKVGVILRDWPAANPQAFGLQMLPTLERLSACFDLTLISLDAATDALTLQTLRSLRQIVWRPDRLGISDFMEKISEQDVLLTARAHGAICGACVGRSSVILEIEPKLRTVHNMLPRVTSIVPPPYDADVIVARLEEALAVSHETIVAEVRRNTAESERALAAVLQGASA